MAVQSTLAPPGAGTTSATSATLLDEVLRLMDDTGLNFVLHTHHPLTHLEYGEKESADPWANTRRECPQAPEARLIGWGASG